MHVIGFNFPRPTEEDYDKFVLDFSSRLKCCWIDDVSLMLYGSYVRGEHNPGRSDIDAVLCFSGGVVIPSSDFSTVSDALARSLDAHYVPFQVTPCDSKTMRDGRFNSYSPSFRNYFSLEGSVLVGPDMRSSWTYLWPDSEEMLNIRFQLRKVRQGRLFAPYFLRSGQRDIAIERFNKSLDAVSRGSKQLLTLVDSELRVSRFSALDAMHSIFPAVDVLPLQRIKTLYSDPAELNWLYQHPNEMLAVWDDARIFFESLVGEYMLAFPSTR